MQSNMLPNCSKNVLSGPNAKKKGGKSLKGESPVSPPTQSSSSSHSPKHKKESKSNDSKSSSSRERKFLCRGCGKRHSKPFCPPVISAASSADPLVRDAVDDLIDRVQGYKDAAEESDEPVVEPYDHDLEVSRTLIPNFEFNPNMQPHVAANTFVVSKNDLLAWQLILILSAFCGLTLFVLSLTPYCHRYLDSLQAHLASPYGEWHSNIFSHLVYAHILTFFQFPLLTIICVSFTIIGLFPLWIKRRAGIRMEKLDVFFTEISLQQITEFHNQLETILRIKPDAYFSLFSATALSLAQLHYVSHMFEGLCDFLAFAEGKYSLFHEKTGLSMETYMKNAIDFVHHQGVSIYHDYYSVSYVSTQFFASQPADVRADNMSMLKIKHQMLSVHTYEVRHRDVDALYYDQFALNQPRGWYFPMDVFYYKVSPELLTQLMTPNCNNLNDTIDELTNRLQRTVNQFMSINLDRALVLTDQIAMDTMQMALILIQKNRVDRIRQRSVPYPRVKIGGPPPRAH